MDFFYTKKEPNELTFSSILVVRVIGLEPTSLAAPDPKSGVSTNFTTRAIDVLF